MVLVKPSNVTIIGEKPVCTEARCAYIDKI